jgi:hypothetical protein
MSSWCVAQMSLAQSLGLARVAETAGDEWLFGSQPPDAELRQLHAISVVCEDGLLHVLLNPPGVWVSLDRTGAEVGRQQATRAEVMTVQLRASPWWGSMRRLLEERGLNPSTTVLGDSFDDDEGVDVGVLATDAGTVIAWRRRYDDDRPEDDVIIAWDDVTDRWQRGPWHEAVESALVLQSAGLARLRSAS